MAPVAQPLAPPNSRPQTPAANSTSSAQANSPDQGAQSLQVITLSIPNPEWQGVGSSDEAQRINSSLSFNYLTSFDIRTLSTAGATSGNDVTGLLFTPDLAPNSPCVNASAPYLPSNVTRLSNLPAQDYQTVAIAPWTSGGCALSYMQAARAENVQGMLFFLPGNNTAIPPPATDPMWTITDPKWKSDNGFPVYVLPGQNGQILVQASGAYNGNMTDVPNGHQLTEYYDSRDYVRLFVDIDTSGSAGSTLPSLWVFLLVVLGILLGIIALTSLSMHLLQRRRRNNLRRRVVSGEVDLEALGIKRLTVPQELLDKMPLYTYGTGQPVTRPSKGAVVQEEKLDGTTTTTTPIPRPNATLTRSGSYHPSPLSQPTCAICLDDFVAPSAGGEGTTVRELPCHHIFHPECVDTFLKDSSSLCPMCKKTALPRGYCPRVITNAMVRRERMVRQVRERVDVTEDPDAVQELDESGAPVPLSRAARIRVRTLSGFSQFRSNRRVTSEPIPAGQQMQQLSSTAPIEPVPATTAPARSISVSAASQPAITPVPQVQPPSTPSRRDWARRRAEAMLGNRAPNDPDVEESRRTPAWRKAVRSVFPGLRG